MTTSRPPAPPRAKLVDIATGLSADSHDNAVTKALDWLTDRHRKGLRTAFDNWVQAITPEAVDMREESPLDRDGAEALMVNGTDWLLARGEMPGKGGMHNINARLLGREGPWFSPAQQRWIAQLAAQPLRLWRVTAVERGQGMTLVDATDDSAGPVTVQERAGSQTAEVGMVLGARLMTAGDHCELSGATYPITRPNESRVLAAFAAALATPGLQPDQQRDAAEWVIARAWLAQFLEPPQMPQLIDAATGDAILLVTDHYRVVDAAALLRTMSGRDDVEGDATDGWRRVLDRGEDAHRVVLSINPGKSAERIEVFARTQAAADDGRVWFESVSGTAVQHLTREVTDPRSTGLRGGRTPGAGRGQGPGPGMGMGMDLSPEQMTAMFEQLMRKHYAHWADEPVPLLGNQTPRQAIATAAGLERVKGLLREYEANEARMAQGDGRAAVSYQFLWDSLGIGR